MMKKIFQLISTVLFSLCLVVGTVATVSAASVKKVTDLVAVTAPTSVTLKWTKPSGAKGYQVQQYSSKKWKTVKTINSSKTTTAKITGLKSKTTYKFRVRAKGSKGYSDYVTISAKTVPPTVKNAAVSPSLQSAKVTWEKAEGVTGYKVEYSTSSKFSSSKTKTVTVKKSSSVKTTISNLSPNKTYYVRVRAYTNHYGTNHYGSYSNVVKFKTAYNTYASNFKVKSTTYNSATLTWSKVSDAGGYQIEKNVGGKWVSVKKNVSRTSTTYVVTGLSPASNVQLRIRPYKTVSGKNYTGVWKTVTASTGVGPVNNLSSSVPTATSVKLTWSAAAGAKGYYVKSNGTTIAKSSTNSVTLNLKPGTTYKITVVAYNGSKQGTASSVKTFTSRCAQVTGVKATSTTETSVTYSWTKATGATSYELQYRKGNGSWSAVASTTSTSYTVSGLEPTSTCQFKVRALNKNGSATQRGEYSAVVTTTTQGVSAVASNDSTLLLKWTPVSGAANYTVQYYNQTTASWVNVKTVTGTSCTVDGSKAANYRVFAKNASGSVIYTSKAFVIKNSDVTVIQNDHVVTVKWPAVSGATGYRVTRSTSEDWKETYNYNSSTYQATYFVAPSLAHNFKVFAVTGSNQTEICDINILAPKLNTGSATAESKNAQLHYLTEAINRSKFDDSIDTTISIAGTSVREVNYLSFGIDMPLADLALKTLFNDKLEGTNYKIDNGTITCYDAGSVSKIFEFMNEGVTDPDEIMYQSETTSNSRTYSKSAGSTIGLLREEGKNSTWHPMEQIFEPAGAGKYVAEIYNGTNSNAVAKAFDVKTTAKGSGYMIEATIKKETTPNYHNGLVSGIVSSSLASATGDGLDVYYSSIGDTKIVAEIDDNCQLVSYTISSPYSTDVGMKMSMAEGSDTLSISMEMKIEGSVSYEYGFTRTE